MPIGDFISKRVYNGKLISRHIITQTSCCRLVDVADGEEKSEGQSYIVCCSFSREGLYSCILIEQTRGCSRHRDCAPANSRQTVLPNNHALRLATFFA